MMIWSESFSFTAMANTDEELEWYAKFITFVESETIRGQVLNIVSFIDELLDSMLINIFPNQKHIRKLLDELDSCLSTIMDKANILFAANYLTEEEFESIKFLARIRNIFAHNWSLNGFDSENITQLTNKFSKKEKITYLQYVDLDKTTNRGKFNCVASQLIGALLRKTKFKKNK